MICAEASPNIAFVKYWGKLEATRDHDRNLAVNPSLSMTLSRARTLTRIEKIKQAARHEIIIGGQAASRNDAAKVARHIERVAEFLGVSDIPALRVDSENNFPQGTGIASSASAFAALTLAVLAELAGFERAQDMLTGQRHELSALARRGSGSACRSFDGPFVKWDGAWAERCEIEWKLFDTILIFSREHKKVPSSEGHAAALSSPHFGARLKNLPARLNQIESALRNKSLLELGPLLEQEALELHGIAESGTPSVKYLLPESEKFLAALQQRSKRDYFFTLDAGPNVHILSQRDVSSELEGLLHDQDLRAEIWKDESGPGPTLART
jgi:diphosphomevalonate decarboxylase